MAKQIVRRRQLVEAAVNEIGAAGSLNVTVGKIAERAGVSSALAFHYFGDKEQLCLAAMRHLLSLYGAEVRSALKRAETPYERLEAIIRANFTGDNFRKEVIAAWLNFYVLAQSSHEAERLLKVYQGRLRSNLIHALRPILDEGADEMALRMAALIDGLYLRMVVEPSKADAEEAATLVLGLLHMKMGSRKG